MTLALEVKDLQVFYGRVPAVHRASLSLPKGGIVALIGPNGAGKTTLLHAIIGLLPHRGQVAYYGESARGSDIDVERMCVRG